MYNLVTVYNARLLCITMTTDTFDIKIYLENKTSKQVMIIRTQDK